CHVRRTSQIGLFMVTSEEGIGSGVRRVFAVTGRYAYQKAAEQQVMLQDLANTLRCPPAQLLERVAALQAQGRAVESALEQALARLRGYQADELLARREVYGDRAMVVAKVAVADPDSLRLLAEDLLQRNPRLLVTLCAQTGDRLSFVAGVGSQIASEAHAGQIIKQVATAAGGSGGGRSDIAQAGSRDVSRLEAALHKAQALLRELLSR
ncbi:MAG: DHHA1 domain-containing protein, partial [Firmicutes bacterium]|nr:DHHA1 domain-containing protein [Bacillota bacterium]